MGSLGQALPGTSPTCTLSGSTVVLLIFPQSVSRSRPSLQDCTDREPATVNKPSQQTQTSPLVTPALEQGQGPAEGCGVGPAPCRSPELAEVSVLLWGLAVDTRPWWVTVVGKSQQRGRLDSTIPTTAVASNGAEQL